MNRKQRRAEGQGGNGGSSKRLLAPQLPASIIVERHIKEQLEKVEQAIRAEAGNRGIQLMLGGMAITLVEKYGWEKGDIGDLVENILATTEAIAGEEMSFEEMMNLCKKYDLEINNINHDKIRKSAEETLAFIEKYKGERLMAKKDEVFKMLDAGETDLSVIANELSIAKSTVQTYQTAWNKLQSKKSMSEKTTEQLANELFGEDEVVEVTPEQGIEELKEVVEEIKGENKVVENATTEKPVLKTGKKKPVVKRIVEVEGEFGKYRATNEVIEINFDTKDMSMGKANLRDLIDELQVVADNMGA